MKRFFLYLFSLLICLAGTGLSAADDVPPPEKLTPILSGSMNKPAAIVAWNRTIAVLRASYEGLSPSERARFAMERIAALAPRPDHEVITTEVTAQGMKAVLITTKLGLLFALLPGDIEPGKAMETEARAAADRLQKVLNEHAVQMRWTNLGWSIGLSLAATLIYMLIIWAVFRGKNAVLPGRERWISQWRPYLTLAGINLVPILLFVVQAISKLLILIIFAAATYLWLTFCFSRFYITQPWSDQLGSYLIDFLAKIAGGIVDAVPGVLTVIVVFWLTRVAAAGVSRFFTGIEKGTIAVTWLQPDSARASRRIVIAVMWIFALTIAYPYIPGSGSDAFKGVSVFAGLMLSLGATGFINHIMSGLVIAYSGAMGVGDYVRVGDIEGTVQELGPVSTRIATPKKEYMTIPNGVAVSAHITNYSRLAGRNGAVVSTTVTIGYDAPWRQVHALLLQAAEKTGGIRTTPAPLVLQRALSDFYVEYELRVSIERPVERIPILPALHGAIQDSFNEAGVQIMSPHFESQPENAVVVPKDRWHTPPAGPVEKEVSKE